jgi:hypothetical protein
MREITEIQKDLARLADRAFDLKKDLYRLIAEIEADHYSFDKETEWAIAFGELPVTVPFFLMRLLVLTAEEEPTDLESQLRQGVAVTDSQLRRAWLELWQPGPSRGWTPPPNQDCRPEVGNAHV